MTSAPPEPPTVLGLPEWDDDPAAADRSAPELAWRAGYRWMRLGRHDHAWAWWERVDDPLLATRVHVSRAASLRELRLHRSAQLEDQAAVEADLADGWEVAGARIGLVADAVGEGDVREANDRLLGAVESVRVLPEDLPSDRQRIRLGWVACEVALMTGGVPAVRLPHFDRDGELSAPSEYRAGSDHHLAKGLLFAGVLARDPGVLDVAAGLAPPGLVWAVHLARADLDVDGAREAARDAWSEVVPPPELADAVADPPGL